MIRDKTKHDLQDAADATATAAQSVLRDGKETARGLAEKVQANAHALGETLVDGANDLAAEVTTRVKDAAIAASDTASQKVDAAKDSIASEGHRLANTLRSAAGDRGDGVRAHVLEAVAGGVETAANSVQARGMSALFADVQTFARRNPGAFVAGAAVLGFALARFMRSGASSGDGKTWEDRS